MVFVEEIEVLQRAGGPAASLTPRSSPTQLKRAWTSAAVVAVAAVIVIAVALLMFTSTSAPRVEESSSNRTAQTVKLVKKKRAPGKANP